ncbi:MAG TPA: RDD family protein [Acidimicrobiia bacterium]|nr:RDD family protein [Acidimicrobiia bacterium]
MTVGSRWCPACGAEYLAGVDTCSDCRVDLQHAPPPAPDHETVTYDLADWDDEQRQALELFLRAADVSFAWEAGYDLVVSHAAEAVVDELIEELEDRPTPASQTVARCPGLPGNVQPGERLATIGQRVLARLIDGLLTVVPGAVVFVFALGQSFNTDQTSLPLGLRFIGLVLPFAYEVSLVAVWGQTLGKRFVGIRVVGPDGRPPGWGRSLRRWLVPFALGMVPFIGWLLGMAVVLRAAFVQDRRGFHDLAADTVVLQDL